MLVMMMTTMLVMMMMMVMGYSADVIGGKHFGQTQTIQSHFNSSNPRVNIGIRTTTISPLDSK
jgi:hypothetical protein